MIMCGGVVCLDTRSQESHRGGRPQGSDGMMLPSVKSEALNEEEEAEYRDLYAYYIVPRSRGPQGA